MHDHNSEHWRIRRNDCFRRANVWNKSIEFFNYLSVCFTRRGGLRRSHNAIGGPMQTSQHPSKKPWRQTDPSIQLLLTFNSIQQACWVHFSVWYPQYLHQLESELNFFFNLIFASNLIPPLERQFSFLSETPLSRWDLRYLRKIQLRLAHYFKNR